MAGRPFSVCIIRLPDFPYSIISPDICVLCYERNVPRKRLRDDHAVEGISMNVWKARQFLSIDSKVEYVFHVIKGIFGFLKTRYRGLK